MADQSGSAQEVLLDIRVAEASRLYDEKGDIAWGNQIRSYVLQPYQLIKDMRTGFEATNPRAVLDGNLDGFINAYLRMKLEQGEEAKKG